MSRPYFHRTVLLFAFAALAASASAAGRAEQPNAQPAGNEIANARSDNDSLYDYRSLSEGSSYYAPGSYASWYYVAPPALEVASTETGSTSTEVASTEPETSAPEYRAPSKDLHKYYDYDRYFGPLFG